MTSTPFVVQVEGCQGQALTEPCVHMLEDHLDNDGIKAGFSIKGAELNHIVTGTCSSSDHARVVGACVKTCFLDGTELLLLTG